MPSNTASLVVAALIIGGILGAAAAMAALNLNIASITAEIVKPSSSSSSSTNGTSLITLNLGKLEAGKTYKFDDLKGYAYFNSGDGGAVTFALEYNSTAFSYVKIEVEIEKAHDSSKIAEFYLDSSSPSYTVNLPANTDLKIEVKVKTVSVSPDASPGVYSIYVLATS